jgi:excisionase family DNA binding protein
LRVEEVADYFSVTDRTIRLWIEHGHLESVKKVGTVRITRESVLDFHYFKPKKQEIPLDTTAEK